VRKCLGVLVAGVTLCAMSWAQAPPATPEPAPTQPPASPSSQAPVPATPLPSAPMPQESSSVPVNRNVGPKYPRIEWFAGYSYAQTGFFNAGHWADLNGWDGSFTLNATSWLGLVVEGGQYFGTSKVSSISHAPFPPCLPFCPTTSPTFNVDTRQYNVLFGAQFPWRKYERWTPFGELMYGHGGVRGEAIAPQDEEIVVSSGRLLVAGGGVDRKINERFAIRFKADYLESNTNFPLLGKKTQDNFRISVGVVIHTVRKKKRRLEDETQPEP
jgi:hypothetical protein